MRGVGIGRRVLLVLAGMVALLPLASASASTSTTAALKTEYRKVLLAEFFGPTSHAVCSQLTAAGVRAYTRGRGSCSSTFATDRRVLEAKLGGGPHSAAAGRTWRSEVASITAHLRFTVRGRHAVAVDPSRVVRRSELVEHRTQWLFDSAPPLPGA